MNIYSKYCPIYLKYLLANTKRSDVMIGMIQFHVINNLHCLNYDEINLMTY